VERGQPIARGLDGAIYEYGPGLVLRQSFEPRNVENEARLMQFLEAEGYPVPHVADVVDDGTAIVMERLDGPMLMDEMAKKFRLGSGLRLTRELLDRLHLIRAPEWLREFEPGGRVVHLDLHPMNIMVTSRGPVVIDWSNGAAGDPLTDVAMTYVLLVGPQMPAPLPVRTLLQPARVALGRAHVRSYRSDSRLPGRVAYAAGIKCFDKNMNATDRARIARIARRWQRIADRERAPG
jgi:aminoglycoside phosphotransferase (APT) family kinase protein